MQLSSIAGSNFTEFMSNLNRAFTSGYFQNKYPDVGTVNGAAVSAHISGLDWSEPEEAIEQVRGALALEQSQTQAEHALGREASSAKAELYAAALATLEKVDWSLVGWKQLPPARSGVTGNNSGFAEPAIG